MFAVSGFLSSQLGIGLNLDFVRKHFEIQSTPTSVQKSKMRAQVYVVQRPERLERRERPIISLRGQTFQTRIHTTLCGSCDFVGNVKYDVFLHNVRIHRRCIICDLNHHTKKGIMDHLANVHEEKVDCDMCDFQVSFFSLFSNESGYTGKKAQKAIPVGFSSKQNLSS